MNTVKFVTFNRDNFKSFSIEYAKLMQTICSEIDVLSKEYCKFLDNTYNADSIPKYSYVITRLKPSIKKQEVVMKKNKDLVFTPWETWEYSVNINKNNIMRVNGKPPKWWTMYNKIKHERTTFSKTLNKHFFKFANQENVLSALSGLFILEMYFYRDIVKIIDDSFLLYPNDKSRLFEIERWDTKNIYAADLIAYIENK